MATLESGWLTMGELIVVFETAFSTYLGHGTRFTAVANGTAALHIVAVA